MLGFRTGDILLSVDGDSLATEESALEALLEHFPDTSMNVNVKRGVNTLTYHYDVI